jgi:sugar phosphate isomerase/epimerase
MPVYFSTGGYKNSNTINVVEDLIANGLNYIELSGTSYAPDNIKKLTEFKSSARFQIHNYFPPPKNPFVINLASMDQEIYKKSLDHIFNAIESCEKINSSHYSFHAGFLCDIDVSEIGKSVKKKLLQNKEDSTSLFIDRLKLVSDKAKKHNINIMLENNVLSKKNLEIFGKNPLLMCDVNDSLDIINNTPDNIKLLVDVAHLKVSANSLNFKCEDFFSKCENLIAGYHLSDNDGLSDSNSTYDENAWFWKYLNKNLDYYSIEVYNLDFEQISRLYFLTKKKLNIL